jgi:hypothetical protein
MSISLLSVLFILKGEQEGGSIQPQETQNSKIPTNTTFALEVDR